MWLNVVLHLLLLLTMTQANLSTISTQSSSSSATIPPPKVLQINQANFNSTLQANDVVFINFYADWCHFSGLLSPIFETAAQRLAEDLPRSAKVVLGRVDCVKELQLAKHYAIIKFPTLRLFYRGHELRQEYRGKRSVEALVEYVKKQFQFAIKRFNDMEQLEMIDVKRRSMIGFFDNRTKPEFAVFEQLAERYKHDCDFYQRVGPPLVNVSYTQQMPTLVYRPDTARTHATDEVFKGDMAIKDKVEAWLKQKCLPLVREVDFSNVEELIEQRLPLLVLFHLPNDMNSVKDFKAIVEMQLSDCRQLNYVTVNGLRFQHSVRHMGKTHRDLPIIAIDSLKLMYPYPKFKDMYIPGHLRQFVESFNNQTLKHESLSSNSTEMPTNSTFKHLGPSKHRYSLIAHDEL
ncbi:hypothetical protein KR215_009728 [Drosophila sulfurigaster]|nr:hypothetical protein KR215_009728 [Drosophila sulfurigaster]